jgi:hypothetical protein
MGQGPSREAMALEALDILLDLADHKEICIAAQQGKFDFCDWEKRKSARYAELIRKLYEGKHKRVKKDGETIGECATNIWFDNAALDRARTRDSALAEGHNPGR